MNPLRTYLLDHDISAAEFSRRSGLSETKISRLCSGKLRPRMDSVELIRNATDGAVQPNDWLSPMSYQQGEGVRTFAEEGSLVGILMGSQSDWPTMRHAADTLETLGVAAESKVISAHRAAARLDEYCASAEGRGILVIIAGAGMAAALPGVVAARVAIPVLGVPMESKVDGMDSLLSMVQMPAGVPVGTLAIGRAGAVNAALLAASILALSDTGIAAKLAAYRAAQAGAPEDPRDEG